MTSARLEAGTGWTAVATGSIAPGRSSVCAECRYAQLYAVQPRALCTRSSSEAAGKVLFAGQPACSDVAPRENTEFLMAWCSPGLKRMSHRFPFGSA
jgi:hypothetical protein